MRTGLAVNPDGAAASYAPGDHGFTYINNGVNLIGLNGERQPCSTDAYQAKCRDEWKKAEAGKFGVGTPMFCSFAIEVEALNTGKPLINCENDKSRYVIGNDKGRPAGGRAIINVDGESVVPYRSTTSLRHTVNGRPDYVDSSLLPALVVPRARGDLVGSIAWVRYGERSTFAIVNDTGPAFGEGSVALHEKLRHGAILNAQRIGPISVEKRCSSVEQLQPPFTSRPDGGHADRCRMNFTPKTPADIRAYKGIDGGVESVILARVKPPGTGRLASIELTPASIKSVAATAGYDEAKMAQIASCVRR